VITKVQQYLLNKLPDKLIKNIIVIENGCWLWQTNIGGGGYGRICIPKSRKRIAAHIYIFKLLKYDYDKNLKLDHVYCTDKRCCNPTHLSPVTNSVNVNRGSGAVFKKISKPAVPVSEDIYLSNLLALPLHR